MKKVLALIIAVLIFVFLLNISALGVDELIISQETNEILPCYEPVCGSYSSHSMHSKGWGSVFRDGETYLFLQSAWQCKRCYLVMVTEGDLFYWGMEPLGYYAIWYADAPISDTGCIIDGAHYYGYTSNNYLSGYQFYKNTAY